MPRTDPTARTGALCFHVTGYDLTEVARALMLEGKYDRAARFLVDGLDGMTWDYAYQILAGCAALVGRSPQYPGEDVGIELEEGVDTGWQTTLEEHFAGTVPHAHAHWQPYAVVTDYGERDAFHEERPGRINRALHYADSPDDRASVLRVGGERLAVLFRRVQIPVWWQPRVCFEDDQAALDEYLEYRGLERRGHRAWYGSGSESAIAPGDGTPKGELLSQIAEARQQREQEECERWERQMERYRAQIREQAGPDEGGEDGAWMTLKVTCEDGPEVYRVPRAPFLQWALARTHGQHLAPDWVPICPQGLKLTGDIPEHSDWMLGMTPDVVDLYDAYQDRALQAAAYRLMWEVQEALLGFEATVLCGSGWAKGEVVHARPDEDCTGKIAVIPTAGPRYTIPAMTALATITEQGGPLAHLAVIGTEKGIKLVRVPGARTRYPVGIEITVDCTRGRVDISDER